MDQPPPTQASPLFAPRTPDPVGTPTLRWSVAGLVLLLLAGLLFLGTRHRAPRDTSVILPLDPYASSLVLSNPKLSESSNLAGGKVTYFDGEIRNAGNHTLSAATVQVLFSNDVQLAPQVETVPLTLIRTHEPYIDIQSVSVAPILPGQTREFRLIFEGIGSNWNQQVPAIHVVSTSTR